MSEQAEPRFYVRELTGYRITGGPQSRTSQHAVTHFFVLDRAYNCRVVASFVPHDNGKPAERVRRALAENRCAQLNRWDELERAS